MPGTFETGAGNDVLVSTQPDSDDYGFPGPTRFLGGSGDDTINPASQTDLDGLYIIEAYGGSGDDTINGGQEDDTLYGDTADSFTGDPVIASFTAAAYDTANDGDDALSGHDGDDTLSGDGGDDQLFGGDGADTLTGGAGSDFLFGGPRGAGDLDILTGGTGADSFLLSYSQASANAGSGFWSAYLEQAGENIAGNAANSIIADAIKAAEDGLAAGFLADGLGAIGGELAQSFVGLIESLTAGDKPKTAQDAMVVTDFDPREDVLVLPLQETVQQSLTASVVAASQIPGGGGSPDDKVLRFSAGGADYAYVQLSADFLTDMGLRGSGDATEQVLNNLVNFSSGIAVQGGKAGFTNLVPPALSSQLPDGGFVAQAGDLPAGSSVLLYGAIGGALIANGPSGASFGSVLAGTNFADALTTNPLLIDPSQITSFGEDGAYIHGFAGADLVYGTDKADTLFGDEDDDTLYSFVSTENSGGGVDPESLSGGTGDDMLYGGGSAGTFDGGDGSDTFGVIYTAGNPALQLEVDLTAGYAAERAAPSDSSAPVAPRRRSSGPAPARCPTATSSPASRT